MVQAATQIEHCKLETNTLSRGQVVKVAETIMQTKLFPGDKRYCPLSKKGSAMVIDPGCGLYDGERQNDAGCL